MSEATLGEASFDLKLNSSEFISRLTDVGAHIARLTIGLTSAAAVLDLIDSKLRESVLAFSAFEDASTKLNLVLDNMGNRAGMSSKAMTDLASRLSEMSGVSKTTIINAEALASTFEKVDDPDMFKRLMTASVNISALWGGDVASSAVALARAMENPANASRALRQLHIYLSEQEQLLLKNMNEAGDSAGAQAFLMNKAEKAAKGAAEALGNTLSGELKKTKTALEELGISIGGLSGGPFKAIVKWVGDWAKEQAKLNEQLKISGEWADKQLAAHKGQIPTNIFDTAGFGAKDEPQVESAKPAGFVDWSDPKAVQAWFAWKNQPRGVEPGLLPNQTPGYVPPTYHGHDVKVSGLYPGHSKEDEDAYAESQKRHAAEQLESRKKLNAINVEIAEQLEIARIREDSEGGRIDREKLLAIAKINEEYRKQHEEIKPSGLETGLTKEVLNAKEFKLQLERDNKIAAEEDRAGKARLELTNKIQADTEAAVKRGEDRKKSLMDEMLDLQIGAEKDQTKKLELEHTKRLNDIQENRAGYADEDVTKLELAEAKKYAKEGEDLDLKTGRASFETLLRIANDHNRFESDRQVAHEAIQKKIKDGDVSWHDAYVAGLHDALNNTKTFTEQVYNAIVQFQQHFTNDVTTMFDELWQGKVEGAAAAFQAFGNQVLHVIDGIVAEWATKGLIKFLFGTPDAGPVKDVLDEAWSWIKAGWNALVSWISDLTGLDISWSSIKSFLTDAFDSAWGYIKAGWDALVKYINAATGLNIPTVGGSTGGSSVSVLGGSSSTTTSGYTVGGTVGGAVTGAGIGAVESYLSHQPPGAGQTGTVIGGAIGGAVGSIFGPWGTIGGAALGGFIGQGVGNLFFGSGSTLGNMLGFGGPSVSDAAHAAAVKLAQQIVQLGVSRGATVGQIENALEAAGTTWYRQYPQWGNIDAVFSNPSQTGLGAAFPNVKAFEITNWVANGNGLSLTPPTITAMAQGGVVNRPTLAMIGESGPEAVTPLGGGGGGDITLQVDGYQFARLINVLSKSGKLRIHPNAISSMAV